MRHWWWVSGVYQLLRMTVVSQDTHLQPPPHSIYCGVTVVPCHFPYGKDKFHSHSLSLSPTPSTFFLFSSSHVISCRYWQIQEAVEDNLTQSLICTTMSSLPYKVYILGIFLQKAVHSVHVGCILRVFGKRAVGSWLDDLTPEWKGAACGWDLSWLIPRHCQD